jgi:ADP-ribosylglycohydrolase
MSAEQAESILFGLALGDALGYAVEFDTLPAIKARYGEKGIQDPPDPALYSDDTQMTVALAEGLLDVGLTTSLDIQMDAVARRFVVWSHSPENNRAPGNTCMSAVRRYESGLSWREAGIANSKGCGSAMRVAMIGYLYQHDERRLIDTAAASSLITHGHPAAVAASIGAALAVKLALDGVPLSQSIPRIMQATDGISADFDTALRALGHAAGWGDEERALSHIGEGWVGEEALALALYCVLRYPDDYVRCMRRAANTNGDSDSIACIAGSISAARLGLNAIPPDWRARCEHADLLRDLALRLAAARDALTA